MKVKKGTLFLFVLMVAVLLAGCRSQDNFGQRKAPKDCNCTRWSK